MAADLLVSWFGLDAVDKLCCTQRRAADVLQHGGEEEDEEEEEDDQEDQEQDRDMIEELFVRGKMTVIDALLWFPMTEASKIVDRGEDRRCALAGRHFFPTSCPFKISSGFGGFDRLWGS
eukprot:1553848-Amphidinium_carterae.1